MLSRLLVNNYRLMHGRLNISGAGWLLQKFAPYLPGLRAYPWPVPEVGVSETIAESRPFMIFEHSHLSDEQVSKLTLPNYHLSTSFFLKVDLRWIR